MVRGWAPLLLVPLSFALGCDSLSARPFAGTVIQMSWSNSQPTAAGHHLELWARDANNDTIRVDGTYTYDDAKGNVHNLTTLGLQVRLAVDPNDPCLIDSKGNLLTSPDAYQTVTSAGVTQSPAQQAQQVKNRIAQVNQNGIGSGAPLYIVVPYGCAANACADMPPLPTIDPSVPAAVRLQICNAYWAATPLAYTGNPAQLTAPVAGAAYGFVAYTTILPPSGYDGMRIDSPTKLVDVQELWVTDEASPVAAVTPGQTGPIFTDSTPTKSGNDVQHFDLNGPGAVGTAAVITNLDDSSVLF
jgi:hypothetical protein